MQKSTTIIGILEMLDDSYSYRDIMARFIVGSSTITDIKKKFSKMNIPLSTLISMDSESIENLFYGNAHPRKNIPLPDFDKIYQLLSDSKRKVNLYFIWIEYKKQYPNGYQYTQFKHLFHRWLDKNHLEQNLKMLVERKPGEVIYIDWIGDTLDLVTGGVDGELQTAHFFVTTIGVSNYCFVYAFPNEKVDSFLMGTVKALEFYGGIPKILKPDNTKTASIKNTKDVLILNKVYEDLQDFYHVVIVPTPPRKPKGKPSVENHVRWLETHLLERLRGRWFSSFQELNEEIRIIITELNTRPLSNGKGNRKDMFEEYDKKALKPLPSEAFRQYSYVVKTVPNNYHIEYDDHYYSVPYTYYKQEITLKASFFDIIICDSMNHKICTHKRLFKPFPKYSTNSDHMPSHHQYYYLENKMDGPSYKKWAETYGDSVYQLIVRVIASFKYEEQSYKSCNAILHLCKDHPKAYCEQAAKTCLDCHIVTYSYFKKELSKLINHEQNTEGNIPKHENIRGKSNYE